MARIACCGCGVREALVDAAADTAAGGSYGGALSALLELHRTTLGKSWSCTWDFESADYCTWNRIVCDMHGYPGQLNLGSCNPAGP